MDQIFPADIARIVITPPAPGKKSLRGWSVRAFRRGEERFPDEAYACASADAALRTIARLLAGERVRVCDYIDLAALNETEGRRHEVR